MLLGLLTVTHATMYNAKVVEGIWNVDMVQSKLIQLNGEGTFVMLRGLLMVTHVPVYNAQVVEGVCNANKFRSKLVQLN